jgi:hypothetical protein
MPGKTDGRQENHRTVQTWPSSNRRQHKPGFTLERREGGSHLQLACMALTVAALDASALLADPYRYVGGFEGLDYDSGQVVPD